MRTAATAATAATAVIGALLSLAACAAAGGDPVPDPNRSEAWTIRLPAAPPEAAVLRIRVSPAAPVGGTAPASLTVHASLYPADQPAQRTRLGSWSLHPPDVAATFVVRVPPALVEASRRTSAAGAGLVLQVDSPGLARVSVQAQWAGLPAR
ncbi:hypothetical protein [Leptothrix discophora]|uniref:Lipoprotein n=1 Tax=Leptothrix discophora TaxID=89 RepID=A0ABT9FYX5_LEPDI|nr:hypothetical protein [Leptothrix discophora]MDP4299336.1 hypothetical protein [Leptothrix discophora]